jgi:uncharacterized delta-60 repeat protein
MEHTRVGNVHRSWGRRALAGFASAALASGLVVGSSPPTQAATLVSETTWGGVGSEVTEGTAIAADGSTYLTGFTTGFDPFGQEQIFLVKVAPDDSIAWQRIWDGPGDFTNHHAYDVAVAPDGSVYVTGSTSGVAGDVVLLKFSPEGTLLWQQRWDSGGTERGDGVAVGADGSIYVAGTTSAAGGNILLLKFTPGGALTWSKTWGPAGAGSEADVAIGPDGNVHVVGAAARTDGSFAFDAVLFKVSPAGSLLMQRAYSGLEITDARGGVAVAPDGSIYVAGAIQASEPKVVVDALLVKFAPDGSLVWDRSWGGKSGDVSGAVTVASNGTVMWAGETNSFGAGGSDDAYLLQVSPDGKVMDSSTWGGAGIDHGEGVEVAADGTILLGATTESQTGILDRGPSKTSRVRGTVSTPNNPLVDVAGATADAAGTAVAATGTSPGGGGFDAALVRIGP